MDKARRAGFLECFLLSSYKIPVYERCDLLHCFELLGSREQMATAETWQYEPRRVGIFRSLNERVMAPM